MSKEYIYKYRTISDNSLNTLVRNQIFVTTPNNFNDPFDCVFPYSVVTVMDDLAKDDEFLRKLYLYKYKKSHVNMPSKKLVAEYIRSVQNAFFPYDFANDLFKLARQAMECIKDENLICCFSKTIDCLPQWAYYCNDSSGFVIEYDPLKVKKALSKYFVKYQIDDVDYVRRNDEHNDLMAAILREYLNSLCADSAAPFCFSREKENAKNLFYLKLEEWKYESEVRFVIARSDSSKAVIDNIKPHAIYLGYKVEPWVVEFMKSYCISSKIGLYQMRIQNGALINDLAKDKIVNMDGTLSK